MKTKVVIAILGTLVVIAGILAYCIFSHGFSARAEPSWMEKAMARRMRRMAIPSGASKLKNPEPMNEATLAEAREHFVEHCSVCHGIDGRGDTAFGRNMYPKVPTLTLAETQQLSERTVLHRL
jgi:mono/diheme cytochrome c family protein